VNIQLLTPRDFVVLAFIVNPEHISDEPFSLPQMYKIVIKIANKIQK